MKRLLGWTLVVFGALNILVTVVLGYVMSLPQIDGDPYSNLFVWTLIVGVIGLCAGVAALD